MDSPILSENMKSIYVKASRSPLGEHYMRNLRGGYAFLQELFFGNVGGMIVIPVGGCQRSGTDLTEPPRKGSSEYEPTGASRDCSFAAGAVNTCFLLKPFASGKSEDSQPFLWCGKTLPAKFLSVSLIDDSAGF